MVNIDKNACCSQYPLHGTECCYNALRLAHALLKNEPKVEVAVSLMADAAVAVRKGQKTPEAYCNMERVLKRVTARAPLQLRRRDSSRRIRRGPDLR